MPWESAVRHLYHAKCSKIRLCETNSLGKKIRSLTVIRKNFQYKFTLGKIITMIKKQKFIVNFFLTLFRCINQQKFFDKNQFFETCMLKF